MKKYGYFIVSGIWLLTAIMQFYQERPLKSVFFHIFAALIFLSIAILWLVFEGRGEQGKKIFNRIGVGYAVVLAILLVLVCGSVLVNKPDGSTLESREKLLESLPRGIGWKIATEAECENHIISGIYSRDNKSGIAVFTPRIEEGYRLLARQWCDSDDIMIANFVIENVWYDVIWFNGAKTEYAEITYTYDGVAQERIIHPAKGMEIFICPAPSENYSLHVAYYDDAGNKYE